MSDILNAFNVKNGLRINFGRAVSGITNQHVTNDEYSLVTEAQIYRELNDKVDISGSSMTGTLYTPTISAATMISGNTNLYDIFITTSDGDDITRIQPGVNIETGGTPNAPTINLVDSPFVNNLTVSGNTNVQTIYATTLISGSTNLYDIFIAQYDIIDGGSF